MSEEIKEIKVHPVYRHAFTVMEHPEGQYAYKGDALGCDCIIVKFVDGFMRMYGNDGKRNEDWYGWGEEVLAPFDGVVESVHINPVTNPVGEIQPGRSGSITFARPDGVRVLYGHVQEPNVAAGDSVRAGDVVARVGNNGYSRCPHIHIGAWQGNTPLQIRFDLREMGKYFKQLGDWAYHC